MRVFHITPERSDALCIVVSEERVNRGRAMMRENAVSRPFAYRGGKCTAAMRIAPGALRFASSMLAVPEIMSSDVSPRSKRIPLENDEGLA